MKQILKVRFLVLLLVCTFSTSDIFAQAVKESSTLTYQAEIGYFVGGTGTVYFFTYNRGLSAKLAVGKSVTEDVLISGSIALEDNQEGRLYPLLANLKKSFGKDTNQFVNFQAGYAWGSSENQNDDFEYQGGVAAGLSYGVNLLSIKETDVYAQMGYRLRQSIVTFQAFEGGKSVSSNLDNHFVALQLGVQF